MLEPQIQGIEAETAKLRAQLDNQGLGNQFTEGLAALRDAINALRTAAETLSGYNSKSGSNARHLPQTVPPDAQFFERSVPLKPAPSNE